MPNFNIAQVIGMPLSVAILHRCYTVVEGYDVHEIVYRSSIFLPTRFLWGYLRERGRVIQ